jgi:nicotinamidase-related amidase
MDVLLIIDMQEGLLRGDVKHDLAGVVDRINRLAARIRSRGGCVIFIQHDGQPNRSDEDFQPNTPGWELLSSLNQEPGDRIVRKKLNDAFFNTTLEADLKELGTEKLFVTGWATDFCVDATVRTAASLGFVVTVVADAHTLSDRPHLQVEQVIEHHHYVWQNLLSEHPVRVINTEDLQREWT